MEDRRKLFNLLFRFARKMPIRFFTAKVKKSECRDSDELETKLTKAITGEINIIFSSKFTDIQVRKVKPVDYRLFQVADLICTLEHIYVKIKLGLFSKTEKEFFTKAHDFKKDYWRKIDKQRI